MHDAACYGTEGWEPSHDEIMSGYRLQGKSCLVGDGDAVERRSGASLLLAAIRFVTNLLAIGMVEAVMQVGFSAMEYLVAAWSVVCLAVRWQVTRAAAIVVVIVAVTIYLVEPGMGDFIVILSVVIWVRSGSALGHQNP